MKIGDTVKDELGRIGIIIENMSVRLDEVRAKGLTRMDIDIEKVRHHRYGYQWNVLWSSGNLECCWGNNLNLISTIPD